MSTLKKVRYISLYRYTLYLSVLRQYNILELYWNL